MLGRMGDPWEEGVIVWTLENWWTLLYGDEEEFQVGKMCDTEMNEDEKN